MGAATISLDKAELLSVWLEALLYGSSLLMFGATIWTLVFRRTSDRVNYKMLTAACLLLLGSTAHLIINFIRVIEGLILCEHTYHGGPVGYFADVSQWTFVSKSYLLTAQTLIGDGVVLYRCYVVWQSRLIMILPVLLWCATAVTGIGTPYTASRVVQNEVFGGALGQWITSFWAAALATNVLTTTLLVCRLWYLDRTAMRLRGHQRSHLRPILRALIDAGAIYSLTLFVELICFASGSNSQYIILSMVMPIISITFYMVIIQVGVTTRSNQTTDVQLENTSRDQCLSVERRQRAMVHITKLTGTDDRDVKCPISPTTSSEERREIELLA